MSDEVEVEEVVVEIPKKKVKVAKSVVTITSGGVTKEVPKTKRK